MKKLSINEFLQENILKLLLLLLFTLILISNILSFMDLGILFPNENQVLYLYSTAAQVIGGIFGLLITGFIFLRGEMEKQVRDDDTKGDAVNELKKKYYIMILFLSINGAIAIILSLLSISFENQINHPTLWKILINTSGSFVITEIIAIFILAIDMVNPNKIEIASNRIINQINKEHISQKADIGQFLAKYNKIEKLLTNYINTIRKKDDLTLESKYKYFVPNGKIIDLLYRNEIIDGEISDKIHYVTKYRNALVHSPEQKDVEQQMIDYCDKVYEELVNAFNEHKIEILSEPND